MLFPDLYAPQVFQTILLILGMLLNAKLFWGAALTQSKLLRSDATIQELSELVPYSAPKKSKEQPHTKTRIPKTRSGFFSGCFSDGFNPLFGEANGSSTIFRDFFFLLRHGEDDLQSWKATSKAASILITFLTNHFFMSLLNARATYKPTFLSSSDLHSRWHSFLRCFWTKLCMTNILTLCPF